MNSSGLDRIHLLQHLVKYCNMKLSFPTITVDNLNEIVVLECDYPMFMPEMENPTLFEFITEYTKCFNLSEWIECIVDNNIETPKTKVIELDVLFSNPEQINEIIKTFPNEQVFVRLDMCSSKSKLPCKNFQEIIDNLNSSETTKSLLFVTNKINNKLIFREFIEIDNFYEFRCIVENYKTRGITTNALENKPPKELKHKIAKFVEFISYQTEFDDCTIDILVPKDFLDKFVFLEINPPVYVNSTSGLFDLDVTYDNELLFGELNEFISIPQLRCIVNDKIIKM